MDQSCDSMCLRIELSDTSKINIYYKFHEVFDVIFKYVMRWNEKHNKIYFRYNNYQSYHISLCVIHPPILNVSMENNIIFYNLGSQDKLLEIAQNKIPRNIISKINILTNCYELLIFVHGYDLNNNEINNNYHNKLPLDLFNHYIGGISHIQFAIRHGTFGFLNNIIDTELIPEINSHKQYFFNPYEGKYNKFISHITIAKLSKVNSQKITIESPRFTILEQNVIFKVYTEIQETFDKNIEYFKAQGNIICNKVSIKGYLFSDLNTSTQFKEIVIKDNIFE
jgi:hypothetical protein